MEGGRIKPNHAVIAAAFQAHYISSLRHSSITPKPAINSWHAKLLKKTVASKPKRTQRRETIEEMTASCNDMYSDDKDEEILDPRPAETLAQKLGIVPSYNKVNYPLTLQSESDIGGMEGCKGPS
jgi:hypothetical protein